MKLPVVSGSGAVKAFGKAGYELDEQHGSHMILRRTDPPHRRLSVPNHKELAKGLSLIHIFADPKAIAREVSGLLRDETRRNAMQANAYKSVSYTHLT